MTPVFTTILYAALILGAIGLIAAVILYFVSKAFKVVEDPRIDEVVEHLPGANCGGCGFAGCRALAEAIVKANTLEGYKCPAGGDMKAIAAVMPQPRSAMIRHCLVSLPPQFMLAKVLVRLAASVAVIV